jgi:ribosome-associated heat shock protein Hsp15
VACLFKTRSEAQRACRGGKVEIGGQTAKPHRLLRVGDEIRITRVRGPQTVLVRGLADRHVAKPAARELYEDRTPPPSADELEARRLAKMMGPLQERTSAPDRRDRRALRRLKGRL